MRQALLHGEGWTGRTGGTACESFLNLGVRHDARKVKVINTGEINRAVTLKGLGVTKGAQAAIEAAGGKVE